MNHRVRLARTVCALGLALVPWLGHAQEDMDGDVTPDAAGCTYNFGSGDFKWCVSSAGNLQMLMSPNNAEHLAFGAVIEGHVLCVNGDALYYDRGALVNVAGWGAPQVVAGPTSSSVTIRLKTLDGNFLLEQKWSRDTAERDLTLQMTLQNLGATSVGPVRLMRLVDIDANSDPSTVFDKSRRAVWFRNVDAVSVIGMTYSPAPVVAVSTQTPISQVPPPCEPPSDAVSPSTTAVASISYDFPSIVAGQKKIVKIGYQVQ